MVERKRPRIAPKPVTTASQDAWVSRGGLDPEVQANAPAASPTPTEKTKPYPHRVSFDMQTPQYKRLKRAAFEQERSINDILREAVEDWLKLQQY